MMGRIGRSFIFDRNGGKWYWNDGDGPCGPAFCTYRVDSTGSFYVASSESCFTWGLDGWPSDIILYHEIDNHVSFT